MALARFGASIGGFAQVAEWLPVLFLLAGLGLAWRFGRGRLFAGLVLLAALWGWVIGGAPWELRPVLAVAIAVVLAATGWARERGLRGWYIAVLALGLLALGAALVLLSTVAYPAYAPAGSNGPLGWTGLPAWSAVPLLAALLALLVASAVRADGVAQGALWATVAAWGALVIQGRAESLTLVAGAMAALVTGTLESIYSAAYRDALTGLPSRRALDERLDALPPGVIVAMVDVDHFKQFNDTHGHDTGDQVLRMVAWRLAEVPDAEAFRYGGEEFTLLFSGGPLAGALSRLEGARSAVAASKFMLRSGDRPKGKQGKSKRGHEGVRHGLSVTISIGAAVRKDGEHPAALLKRADEALYAAKEAGRDRVVTAK
ncbi:MAG TPA: GGDEF domain-containing protein [Gemmatimonadales bacterium]|nr:GGDEF domain-containing protein [Gemmatimonadales bacterium]